jgi:hypothetical protein
VYGVTERGGGHPAGSEGESHDAILLSSSRVGAIELKLSYLSTSSCQLREAGSVTMIGLVSSDGIVAD